MSLYVQKEGEWVAPRRKKYGLVCCDCGLRHSVNFRIVKGQLQYQVFRDDKWTDKYRKRKKIQVTNGI